MPRFRIGIDNFRELRREDGYFVDKSLLIREVLDGGKVTLLPRPRRFGKTLNMTMLRYFFERGEVADSNAALFADLAIAKDAEAMRHQGRYPVIYVSLKDIKGADWEIAYQNLVDQISALYREHEPASESLTAERRAKYMRICLQEASVGDLQGSLKHLVTCLHAHYGQPAVVLIDEYDSPIIEAWREGYYDEMIRFMRAWLGGGLKHESGEALFRGVITGILRVARESIFSGLNNLDVRTVLASGAFADKFGFTQTEVDQILADFGLPELAEPMREWYNGYSFGGHTIYNPWSVVGCVSRHPSPVGPQWLNTASNDLVHAELEAGGLPLKRDLEKLLAGEAVRYPVHEHTVFADIGRNAETIWSFLVFSGYLKASEPQEDPLMGLQLYSLTIPNREVRLAYRDFVGHWHRRMSFGSTDELLYSLVTDDIDNFAQLLSELVRGLLSCHDPAKHPEAVYHALVLGLLANLRSGYHIRSNHESGYGRADILMQPRTTEYPLGFVIEFKAIAADGDLDAAVDRAHAQITDKAYATELLESGVAPEHLRQLAIIFNGKDVTVKRLP